MNIQEAKELIESEVVREFIDVCPHCGARAHLKMIHNDYYIKENDLIFYVNFKCVPCKKLILETFKFNRYSSNSPYEIRGWVDKFPNEQVVYINKFKESIPENIINDFEEGVISLKSKCFKAAVSMFRRSLQSAVLDLGANKNIDLISQIKSMDILTGDIKDWAHNIRIFGNWGAHPQDDNLKEISKEIAEEAKDFMEEFFNYVYVMPARVKKVRPQKEENEENEEIGESENKK